MKKEDFYKKYTELLKDRDFLIWRLTPTEELDAYWAGLQEKHPLLCREVLLADNYLKEIMFRKKYLNIKKKEDLLQTIFKSIEQDEIHKKRMKIKLAAWLKYGTVACLLIFIGISLYINKRNLYEDVIVVDQLGMRDIQLITADKTIYFEENIDVLISDDGVAKINKEKENYNEIRIKESTQNILIVPYGKRSKVELSDGTKIWLNSGSTMEFPSSFEENKREIKLLGEMYIEVAPDENRAFYVNTSDFKIKVCGTKFNVSAYKEYSQTVVLVEGSVELQQEGQTPYKLLPNEMAIYGDDKTFKKQFTETSKYTSWINGYIIMEETPICEALEYIERYYNVSFSFSNSANLSDITCSGKLFLSENVNNVIRAIALLSNTRYSKEDNSIYISN